MRKILTWPLRFYQRRISPMLPPRCRFTPTCSQYAIDAINKFSVLGIFPAVWRLLRCNPLCKCGYDPVPDSFLGWKGLK
ncbi:MAG: membrane protein insertion efficiency factor YidD [Oscillospiraceae bacterium]|nr:membrane protein insertion efficiency factor YidD [Oscillospiraceae bacterium]